MDLPADLSRWSITTYGPDGHRARLGKYRLHISGETIEARSRNGTVVASIVAVDAVRNGSKYAVTAADGTRWELSTCSCGG